MPGFFQDCTHIFSVCLSSHSLPKVVKRRVNALKNLQVKCAHIEAKFYEEVHELERKYAALYQPLFDKVRHLYIFFIMTFNTRTEFLQPEIILLLVCTCVFLDTVKLFRFPQSIN